MNNHCFPLTITLMCFMMYLVVMLGRCKKASEVLRAGLRFLEEESKIVALKKAIDDGFESKLAKHFNAKKHLDKLKSD